MDARFSFLRDIEFGELSGEAVNKIYYSLRAIRMDMGMRGARRKLEMRAELPALRDDRMSQRRCPIR